MLKLSTLFWFWETGIAAKPPCYSKVVDRWSMFWLFVVNEVSTEVVHWWSSSSLLPCNRDYKDVGVFFLRAQSLCAHLPCLEFLVVNILGCPLGLGATS